MKFQAQVAGSLRIRGQTHPLASFRSVYTRLMDDRFLPELEGESADSARRRQCRSLHEALLRWTEIAPPLTINRPSAMASNISKPYQSQLIRKCGFRIPETLVTNEPDLVRRFFEEHRRVIYKSVSGVRSIVQDLAESDFDRIEQRRWCPTQFQASPAPTYACLSSARTFFPPPSKPPPRTTVTLRSKREGTPNCAKWRCRTNCRNTALLSPQRSTWSSPASI